MTLALQNITKSYGKTNAVNDISFELKRGELTGLLGPNGAGKSTIFRAMVGLSSIDGGQIIFDEKVVDPSSTTWKNKIGYLSENNPLYYDMYVRQFLLFICQLHHLDNSLVRVEKVISLLGLEDYKKYKIKALSKGYRQRVGIAQAILNDPEILILDEPTTGLDPIQLIEIRQLIKSLSSNRIVVISSHILKEIEEICERVVLINNGKVVKEIMTSGMMDNKKQVSIRFDKNIYHESLLKVGKLLSESKDDHLVVLELLEGKSNTDIFDWAVENEVKIVEMITVKEGLEIEFRAMQ
jgi:ABC-2 type transport system ATP-binding protein